jgi:hypothetical protein
MISCAWLGRLPALEVAGITASESPILGALAIVEHPVGTPVAIIERSISSVVPAVVGIVLGISSPDATVISCRHATVERQNCD